MFKSRLCAGVLVALGLAACGSGLHGPAQASVVPTTPQQGAAVSIQGTRFLLNGEVAAPGGLLLNSRMVQGIFDDENATVSNWAYPDTGTWNADRNTNEFIAAMPSYAAHGVRMLTVGLQGGCPIHTNAHPHCDSGTSQPFLVSAFKADGSLKPAWLDRLDRVIRAANTNGIVITVEYFYGPQSSVVNSPDPKTAQSKAVDNITKWLVDRKYTNILVETANECDVSFNSSYLGCGNEPNVVKQVQKDAADAGGSLLVSFSYGGGLVPEPDAITQSDFVLIHGNGQTVARIVQMIGQVKALPAYTAHPKPIVMNEDIPDSVQGVLDHMNATVTAGASWGFLDVGRNDPTDKYVQGFQAPPVNWTINTSIKHAFFDRAAQLVAAGTPTALTYSGPRKTDYHDMVTLVANLADSAETPVAGDPIRFSLNDGDSCTGYTDGAGRAACMILPTLAAGTYPVAVTFPGDQAFDASQAAGSLELDPEETALAYTGDTTFVNGGAAHLSAVLSEDGGPPIAERSVALTLGTGSRAQTCAAATDTAGKASCQLAVVSQPLGTTTEIGALFAGDHFYKDAATSATTTTVSASSGLTYTGPLTADYHDGLMLSAHLADQGGAPGAGLPVSFALGSQTCSATTDGSGTGACQLASVSQPPAAYQVIVMFAGNERFSASRASADFVVGREQSTIVYAGDANLTNGTSARLAATLLEDGTGALPNRSVTLTLGTGGSAQHCTAITDATAIASCAIGSVNQGAGSRQVTAAFAGDSLYLPATTQASVAVASPAPASTLATTGRPRTIDIPFLVLGLALMAIGVSLAGRRRWEI